MTNSLKVFNNQEFGKVRVVEINNEPWFIGKDLIECLGYNMNDIKKNIENNTSEEDRVFYNSDYKSDSFSGSDLGRKGGYLVNESGMYSLIFGSQLESAKKFKRWITSEVLPQIRKTGSYSLTKSIDSYMIQDPIERAKAWIQEEQQRQLLAGQVQEMKPKAELCDERIDKRGSLTFTDVTRTLGLKRGQISVWAKTMGYIHKTRAEVNENGRKYFNVYGIQHPSVGITEEGLKLINDNIEDIRLCATSMPKKTKDK